MSVSRYTGYAEGSLVPILPPAPPPSSAAPAERLSEALLESPAHAAASGMFERVSSVSSVASVSQDQLEKAGAQRPVSPTRSVVYAPSHLPPSAARCPKHDEQTYGPRRSTHSRRIAAAAAAAAGPSLGHQPEAAAHDSLAQQIQQQPVDFGSFGSRLWIDFLQQNRFPLQLYFSDLQTLQGVQSAEDTHNQQLQNLLCSQLHFPGQNERTYQIHKLCEEYSMQQREYLEMQSSMRQFALRKYQLGQKIKDLVGAASLGLP